MLPKAAGEVVLLLAAVAAVATAFPGGNNRTQQRNGNLRRFPTRVRLNSKDLRDAVSNVEQVSRKRNKTMHL